MLSESRPRSYLDFSLSRASSGSALSSGFISMSRGRLTGIRNPLLGVPSHRRPADIDLITRKSFVAAAVHPMITLEVADDRLDKGSFLHKSSQDAQTTAAPVVGMAFSLVPEERLWEFS